MTPIDSVSLLPCPFCGGKDLMVNAHECSGYELWEAHCFDCGAQIDREHTEADAIAAWNRRSPPSVPVSELKELVTDAMVDAACKAYDRKECLLMRHDCNRSDQDADRVHNECIRAALTTALITEATKP